MVGVIEHLTMRRRPSGWLSGSILASFLGLVAGFAAMDSAAADSPEPFDGRPWNLSTGNLSVTYVQASPIGAFPRSDFHEAPPTQEALAALKNQGLVANEDYVAWGAVEREPGKWDWSQHDAMEQSLHKAGLKYVAYCWVHFPPAWLRERAADRTLMRCLEHGEETNYLSVFDPRTIEWYDHFYRALDEHFGDRIDDVYACILGPYGEGNYPLAIRDWVNMGHCHEGYWCADEHAVRAFRSAMGAKYSDIAKLNAAWAAKLNSFAEVQPPEELKRPAFKPSPSAFATAGDKRRWLDFITWYHQAIIDFAEQSVRTALKYFPAAKVRTKPGGSAGGVNPIAWGTYCPGYARMARGLGVVLQPADCQGAVFADKWMGTAYQFYGVKECTEPAGGLDDATFRRRLFSDASAGAAQFFTYEFPQHVPDIHKYIQLINGTPGETEVAIYCPTTLYRLGGDLQPTIQASRRLRDVCDFDVLDEVLIDDGALTTSRYKVLVVVQGDIVDQPVLDRFQDYLAAGGRVVVVGDTAIKNVQGDAWKAGDRVERISADWSAVKDKTWLAEVAKRLAGLRGVDGTIDGVWTTQRGPQRFAFNTNTTPTQVEIAGKTVVISPSEIHIAP